MERDEREERQQQQRRLPACRSARDRERARHAQARGQRAQALAAGRTRRPGRRRCVSKPATHSSTASPSTTGGERRSGRGSRARRRRGRWPAPGPSTRWESAREALGVRVAEHDGERHRREREAERVQHGRRQHERGRRTAPRTAHTSPRAARPRGSSRPAVRGFRASIAWSASRLKPMAALRAAHHRHHDPDQLRHRQPRRRARRAPPRRARTAARTRSARSLIIRP